MTIVVDTSKSPHARLTPVSLEAVRLQDKFWLPRLEKLRNITIPSQYELLESTGRLFNFRRVAGKARGDFKGLVFNDSDVYKWVEAASFLLAGGFDKSLYDLVGKVVDEIALAQDEDGYVNTFFSLERKNQRWTNLRDMHELYCAGHLIQAAIALFRATGNSRLLEVATRFADHIVKTFGPGGRLGVPGHPEVEMALIELYRETGNKSYLDVAKIFIDNRGKGIIGGSQYHIDHKPFRELSEIVGHAVRALYLNCGAADLYMETGDLELWNALNRLWDNMVNRKMYVTGGLGSRHDGEAFGFDYELPNVQAYSETCAAIASFMWNWRMFLASGEAKYVDIMELTLYNAILAGISLNGKEYFYVNPLADRGKHRRQAWFECACCPPNIARLLAGLPGYFYAVSKNEVWINFYCESTAEIELKNRSIKIIQRTGYPWEGDVTITLHTDGEQDFIVKLRIPGWSNGASVSLNGAELETDIRPGTYLEINRTWKTGDTIKISLPMPVRKLVCNPNVYENLGRIALMRGPIVYCFEAVDNPGFDVWDLIIPGESILETEYRPDLLDGVVIIKGTGYVMDSKWSEESLYNELESKGEKPRKVDFTAIPYYAWCNRKPGPMTVWARTVPFGT
ncbi:MAG: glycoside hydrolase family 127 protein [Candidatus Brockarchaeota archaeon]|nr:glycoside hydrolase family 127 protein [Candidatus Brockarchaeota archaeon]